MQKYAKTRITMYAVFVTLQYIRKYMVPRKDASCDCLNQRLLRVQLLYRIVLLQFLRCMYLDLIEHVCVCVCVCVCMYAYIMRCKFERLYSISPFESENLALTLD